jgi:hypothetical protein
METETGSLDVGTVPTPELETVKKVYEKAGLTVHGDLKEITAGVPHS